MDGLKPGRIVYFVFDAHRAAEVMRRRTSSASIAERMTADPPRWPAGAQAHIGNSVAEGSVCPAMVVAVNSQENGNSNLKVMLDGADEYWATSIVCDVNKTPGTWHWMFDGQSTRYDASKTQ